MNDALLLFSQTEESLISILFYIQFSLVFLNF